LPIVSTNPAHQAQHWRFYATQKRKSVALGLWSIPEGGKWHATQVIRVRERLAQHTPF